MLPSLQQLKRPKLPAPGGGPNPNALLNPPKKKKIKGKGGSSCHQCKSRRNFTALTYCTSNLDKKNKKCRKKFCGHCLKKFYKETPQAIADKACWRCPSCRKICCCAACRRRKQKDLGIGVSPPVSSGGGGGGNKSSSSGAAKKKAKQAAFVPHHHPDIPHPPQHHGVYANVGGNHPDPSPVDSPSMSDQYVPHTPRDVSVPPVPTVMMPTSGLSSPMTTPIQMPTQFEFLPENLQLRDEEHSDSDQCMYQGSDDCYQRNGSATPPVQYPNAELITHIKRHAYQAVVNGHQTPFGVMYQLYQHNSNINKEITVLLQRQDLQQPHKVEAIANILRASQENPPQPAVPVVDPQQMAQQHMTHSQATYGDPNAGVVPQQQTMGAQLAYQAYQ